MLRPCISILWRQFVLNLCFTLSSVVLLNHETSNWFYFLYYRSLDFPIIDLPKHLQRLVDQTFELFWRKKEYIFGLSPPSCRPATLFKKILRIRTAAFLYCQTNINLEERLLVPDLFAYSFDLFMSKVQEAFTSSKKNSLYYSLGSPSCFYNGQYSGHYRPFLWH